VHLYLLDAHRFHLQFEDVNDVEKRTDSKETDLRDHYATNCICYLYLAGERKHMRKIQILSYRCVGIAEDEINVVVGKLANFDL
jgi:hypothetical protein